jgi:ferredoxin-NADP reductase
MSTGTSTTGLEVRVTGRREIADRVAELELAGIAGGPLPAWEAGAHIELVLAPGLVRHYSLCGDPDDRASWRIAVLRAEPGRGGSAAVHDKLTVGSTLTVRGPRNRFPLVPAQEYLFIAGGIGITPLVPMLAHAQRTGARWRLAYGGRTRGAMAYASELAARYGNRVRLWPRDERGDLDLNDLFASAGPATVVYCCGPEGLLRAAGEQAERTGAELHVERFTAGEVDGPGGGEAFAVNLLDSGLTVEVGPEETVLEAVERAGIFVLSSCREGVCGTCGTRVARGEVDHRDSYLTDEEKAAGGVMMICVSRSAGGDLDLEL